MSTSNFTVRLPYHQRFGPAVPRYAPPKIEEYIPPPSIPPVLYEASDFIITIEDEHLLHTWKSPVYHPAQDYAGDRQTQLAILAEDKAAGRLRKSKPHVYAAMEAADRISTIVRRTPLIDAAQLVNAPQAEVLLKLENRQYERSFKLRGAANAILQLNPDQLEKGVATASAGNHGLGVAHAAHEIGISAQIYMSRNASPVKVNRIKELGARVIQVGETFDEARTACELMVVENPGLTLIHPYNNRDVTIGQATMLIEYLWEKPELDVAVLPIGGGGLIAWNAAMIKEYNSDAYIYGVQLKGSEAARQSKAAGRVVSISTANPLSDGTAVRSPGDIPFPFIQDYVDEIVTVSDLELARSVVDYDRLFPDRVEAAGALALAGMRSIATNLRGTAVGVISGGNISNADLKHLYDLTGTQYAPAA